MKIQCEAAFAFHLFLLKFPAGNVSIPGKSLTLKPGGVSTKRVMSPLTNSAVAAIQLLLEVSPGFQSRSFRGGKGEAQAAYHF